MQLRIDDTQEGPRTILAVSGEVDLATAPNLRQRVVQAIDDGARQVVVDLSDVGFMDSTGLGVLIGGLKRLRQRDGNLVVVSPSEPVAKILEVTGLMDVLGVVDSVDDVPDPV